ncbi:L7Ae/L30e/S12e/Gadd45 family ribosomal protein [Desulfuribacillus alkaliarsenatis]|uniref:Ribosomal protein eL8/eL30/eS12/Gadd45 domain-containing protein n=1 Tax=Desulfuribacillus alkaliarsenatis TaxID=766136 RepID=A0A1E5G6C3_9FIRM|nr:ribosomal L7Ae/L30e/S12e/Gadd45 family protein [Desulfuribacillus alkaliarsenatis]OEF98645.1 hypothetical protein BHF68_02995 [Desulfuribacillus alkaliarsenatis]
MNAMLNFLGLANRARKVISGEETVIKRIQRNGVELLIIAEDTSEQTKKMFIDKCSYYNVKYKVLFSKACLGNAIGKSPRSACAITDKGFAKKLLSMIEENYGGGAHE